ncbi:MAG: hypothetical protein AAF821_14350 [Cyanobacteria bacterium P01_D01_bin.156]
MSRSAPSDQPTLSLKSSREQPQETLGPEYTQRITPLGQTYITLKPLQSFTQSTIAVLQRQPLGRLQPWSTDGLASFSQHWTTSDSSMGEMDTVPSDYGSSVLQPQLFPASPQSTVASEISRQPYHSQISSEVEADAVTTQDVQRQLEQRQPYPLPPSELQQNESHSVSLADDEFAEPTVDSPHKGSTVQRSPSVYLPKPVQRSPQLQRQIKSSKSKILRSLQSPPSSGSTNSLPIANTGPGVNRSAPLLDQAVASHGASVPSIQADAMPGMAGGENTPTVRVEPQAGMPSAMEDKGPGNIASGSTSIPDTNPVVQRSDSGSSEPESRAIANKNLSRSSNAAMAAEVAPPVANEPSPSIDATTHVQAVAKLQQRSATVKQQVQQSKLRSLQRLPRASNHEPPTDAPSDAAVSSNPVTVGEDSTSHSSSLKTGLESAANLQLKSAHDSQSIHNKLSRSLEPPDRAEPQATSIVEGKSTASGEIQNIPNSETFENSTQQILTTGPGTGREANIQRIEEEPATTGLGSQQTPNIVSASSQKVETEADNTVLETNTIDSTIQRVSQPSAVPAQPFPAKTANTENIMTQPVSQSTPANDLWAATERNQAEASGNVSGSSIHRAPQVASVSDSMQQINTENRAVRSKSELTESNTQYSSVDTQSVETNIENAEVKTDLTEPKIQQLTQSESIGVSEQLTEPEEFSFKPNIQENGFKQSSQLPAQQIQRAETGIKDAEVEPGTADSEVQLLPDSSTFLADTQQIKLKSGEPILGTNLTQQNIQRASQFSTATAQQAAAENISAATHTGLEQLDSQILTDNTVASDNIQRTKDKSTVANTQPSIQAVPVKVQRGETGPADAALVSLDAPDSKTQQVSQSPLLSSNIQRRETHHSGHPSPQDLSPVDGLSSTLQRLDTENSNVEPDSKERMTQPLPQDSPGQIQRSETVDMTDEFEITDVGESAVQRSQRASSSDLSLSQLITAATPTHETRPSVQQKADENPVPATISSAKLPRNSPSVESSGQLSPLSTSSTADAISTAQEIQRMDAAGASLISSSESSTIPSPETAEPTKYSQSIVPDPAPLTQSTPLAPVESTSSETLQRAIADTITSENDQGIGANQLAMSPLTNASEQGTDIPNDAGSALASRPMTSESTVPLPTDIQRETDELLRKTSAAKSDPQNIINSVLSADSSSHPLQREPMDGPVVKTQSTTQQGGSALSSDSFSSEGIIQRESNHRLDVSTAAPITASEKNDSVQLAAAGSTPKANIGSQPESIHQTPILDLPAESHKEPMHQAPANTIVKPDAQNSNTLELSAQTNLQRSSTNPLEESAPKPVEKRQREHSSIVPANSLQRSSIEQSTALSDSVVEDFSVNDDLDNQAHPIESSSYQAANTIQRQKAPTQSTESRAVVQKGNGDRLGNDGKGSAAVPNSIQLQNLNDDIQSSSETINPSLHRSVDMKAKTPSFKLDTPGDTQEKSTKKQEYDNFNSSVASDIEPTTATSHQEALQRDSVAEPSRSLGLRESSHSQSSEVDLQRSVDNDATHFKDSLDNGPIDSLTPAGETGNLYPQQVSHQASQAADTSIQTSIAKTTASLPPETAKSQPSQHFLKASTSSEISDLQTSTLNSADKDTNSSVSDSQRLSVSSVSNEARVTRTQEQQQLDVSPSNVSSIALSEVRSQPPTHPTPTTQTPQEIQLLSESSMNAVARSSATPGLLSRSIVQESEDNDILHRSSENESSSSINSSELTVAQLLRQDALPIHPTNVAADMAVIPTHANVVQPALVDDIAPDTDEPDDDSDDLARFFSGAAQKQRSNASKTRHTQQKKRKKDKKQLNLHQAQYLPPGISGGVHGIRSSRFMGQSAQSADRLQESLFSRAQIKAEANAYQGRHIKKIDKAELGDIAPKLVPAVEMRKFETQEKQDDEKSKATDTVDDKSFELLAREVYHLLQQRLAVERERFGGYYRDRTRF